MKIRTTLALSALTCLIQCGTANADDLFRLFWTGAAYYRDPAGNVIRREFSDQELVNTVAHNNGLDPSTLVFVYRPNRRDAVVVIASTGAFVADVLQMEYTFTDVSNAAGTLTVRHAFLYDEAHQAALGSAIGAEYPVRDSAGRLVNYSFAGRFSYAKTESHVVYVGDFRTGQRIVDRSGAP